MVAYNVFFSPSCDIDLLTVQASLCSSTVPVELASAVADRIRALPFGYRIEPTDIAWCVAGTLGSHSLLREHRDWARDFLDVRIGRQCPAPDACSLTERRALNRHRNHRVRSWAAAARKVGQQTFRISFNAALMLTASELRVVRMTRTGWADGAWQPESGAWASPEEALLNVGPFRWPTAAFANGPSVEVRAIVELLLTGDGTVDTHWHWPAIVRLMGNANAFRLAVRYDRMDDAAPWLALASPELVELCQDEDPAVRTAVVTATSTDGISIDGRESRHPSRGGKRM